MTILELFIIALGLSMDAFAVAICKGLSMRKFKLSKAAVVGLYFGVFQAAMPLIGYFIGARFADKIEWIDHWIAFVLLAIIGGKMIKESFDKEDCGDACEVVEAPLSFARMFPLALATSIDALIVGVTFAFLRVSIVPAVTFIGSITFVLSVAGVGIGNFFGARFKSKAELLGGVILVLMGLKILLEHLEIINF